MYMPAPGGLAIMMSAPMPRLYHSIRNHAAPTATTIVRVEYNTIVSLDEQ